MVLLSERFDDVPGTAPRMRIWGRYSNGENLTSPGPGWAFDPSEQNEDYTSGIGWEELSNTWMFSTAGNPNRKGMVIASRVAASSGSPALDQEAMALVRRAQPFPAPPPPPVSRPLAARQNGAARAEPDGGRPLRPGPHARPLGRRRSPQHRWIRAGGATARVAGC